MDLVREKVGVTACTWCRRPHADGCWTDNRLTCCDTRVCAECFITTVDETKRGRVHVPTRRYKTKKQLRKRSDDVKTSFHAFNGRCAHEIIPFAGRERYAMMFYCVDGYKGVPEGVKRAPEGVQRALKGVKHRTKNTGYSTSCKKVAYGRTLAESYSLFPHVTSQRLNQLSTGIAALFPHVNRYHCLLA